MTKNYSCGFSLSALFRFWCLGENQSILTEKSDQFTDVKKRRANGEIYFPNSMINKKRKAPMWRMSRRTFDNQDVKAMRESLHRHFVRCFIIWMVYGEDVGSEDNSSSILSFSLLDSI